MAWTDKMVEDLKIMWKQGLTTGEIGKRLGVSKNSIVGKVHRLQLDARPSPIKKKDEMPENKAPEQAAASVSETAPVKTAEKPKETAKAKPAAKPVSPAVEEKNIPSPAKPAKEPVKSFTPKPAAPAKSYNGNAKLTDLDNHTCRWPIGDPKDENFHFCGRKIRMGQTYCEEHAALAYVKPTSKK